MDWSSVVKLWSTTRSLACNFVLVCPLHLPLAMDSSLSWMGLLSPPLYMVVHVQVHFAWITIRAWTTKQGCSDQAEQVDHLASMS
jgi:hypothetical protein